jgi:ammonia channel protein AmtB
MQADFAMVEVGFARAKNATNILMKNLPEPKFTYCILLIAAHKLCRAVCKDGRLGSILSNQVRRKFTETPK